MKLSLSANISKLRKEHAMTQEQLAEALGVTFASVSKWERGVATPELNLIAEMADLFEVSIDALIGYQFRNNNRETVITRLKQYSHDRDTEDVFSDVEKALQCYPNCFDVVYYSARIYRLRGLTQKNAAYSKKALSLCGCSAAAFPSPSVSCLKVVNLGLRTCESVMPSYPATETSFGTESPSFSNAFSAPIAEKSSGKSMHVGGSLIFISFSVSTSVFWGSR